MDLFQSINKTIDQCYKVRAIRKLIEIITKLPGDPAEGKKGGYLVFCSRHSYLMIARPVGEISKGEEPQYLRSATEIVTQLVESADLQLWTCYRENGQIGGGFLLEDYIIGFDGFSKNLNEALLLVYSIYVSGNSDVTSEVFKKEAEKIIRLNNFDDNPYIIPVLEQFFAWYVRIELGQGEKISVLMVDDDEDRLENFKQALSHRGIFEVSLFESLEEAKNIYQPSQYDIVISDDTVKVKGDGQAWLVELSEKKQNVIVYTNDDISNMQRIRKNGFDFDGEQIIEMICRMMKI
jgi:CheY-like chemotaxis protein